MNTEDLLARFYQLAEDLQSAVCIASGNCNKHDQARVISLERSFDIVKRELIHRNALTQ